MITRVRIAVFPQTLLFPPEVECVGKGGSVQLSEIRWTVNNETKIIFIKQV